MRVAVRSGQFRRDVKRAQKRGKDMSKLRELILLLLAEDALPGRYRDHPPKGDWKSYHDARITAKRTLRECLPPARAMSAADIRALRRRERFS